MIANFAKRRSLLQKKARPEPGFQSQRGYYLPLVLSFVASLRLSLASALDLLFGLAFFSPLVAFFSTLVSAFVSALVSDFGAWAYAPSANADATSATSSFFNMGSLLSGFVGDP